MATRAPHQRLMIAMSAMLVGVTGCQALAGLVDLHLDELSAVPDTTNVDGDAAAAVKAPDGGAARRPVDGGDQADAESPPRMPLPDGGRDEATGADAGVVVDATVVDSAASDGAAADAARDADAGATVTFGDSFDTFPGLGPGWSRNEQPSGNVVGVQSSVSHSPPNALLSTIGAFNGSAAVTRTFNASLGATVHATFSLQMALGAGAGNAQAYMYVATIESTAYDRLQIWRQGNTGTAALCVGPSTPCVTSDVAIPDSSGWLTVDMSVHFATDTTGWYVVRVNGTTWAAQSGIATASSAPGNTMLQLGLWSNGGYPSGAHAYYDDVAVDITP